MGDLLHAYENGATEEPDPRVVDYFTKNPDGGNHAFYPNWILKYIDNVLDEQTGYSDKPKCACAVCGCCTEGSGWKDLCSRRCYRDMGDLLYAYENWDVDEPDPRVVDYFTKNPDGGNHAFFPNWILKYIDNVLNESE